MFIYRSLHPWSQNALKCDTSGLKTYTHIKTPKGGFFLALGPGARPCLCPIGAVGLSLCDCMCVHVCGCVCVGVCACACLFVSLSLCVFMGVGGLVCFIIVVFSLCEALCVAFKV